MEPNRYDRNVFDEDNLFKIFVKVVWEGKKQPNKQSRIAKRLKKWKETCAGKSIKKWNKDWRYRVKGGKWEKGKLEISS